MPGDSAMQISLDGKSYAIEDFELGELEWLEDELGGSLDEINPNSMKAAVRFVTVIKRRDNPEFTIEEARKMTLRVFDTADQGENGDGPAKRPTKRPAKRAGKGG